ncbi:MAG: nucleotide sugar dehydrogenase [Thermodesulfobacteriota bacterium]|nr:nucleotide sugar dehydrogenase [Thermodesulfobacteriota bacterium]
MKSDLKKNLLDNKNRLGIWGCGYIGFTTAVNFAINGVKVVGYDINKELIKNLNNGKIPIPNLDYWLGFPIDSLIETKLFHATQEVSEMLSSDIKVHMVAIPTEKNGEPFNGYLIDVIKNICKRISSKDSPDLIIIESTLTPGNVEKILVPAIKKAGKDPYTDCLIGVAPRRDWFHSPEKNLKNLPRVVCGLDKKTTDYVKDVLSIVCDNLITASSIKIAELVKSVENSLLHVPSVYAMQLARAYPDLDIKEAFRLAGTHWRIPVYYPSMGTGGYCVPVSSKYVKLGATNPEILTIIDETIKFDEYEPRFIAEIVKHKGGLKVGILGIAYKGDLKVHTLSPALSIIDYLTEMDIKVSVHDPYYSEDEIKDITGCSYFSYPDGLSQFDTILIIPAHRIYTQTPREILFKYIKEVRLIMDNMGAWDKFREDFKESGISYNMVGDPNWCK